MSEQDSPQLTCAILGASSDRSKYGNKSLRAHIALGYQVFPINPKGGTIEGLEVLPSLTDIPLPRLNRISVYLPPTVLQNVLPDLVAKPCDELFFNPGSDDPEVVAAAEALGLEPIRACSIVELGRSPAEFGA